MYKDTDELEDSSALVGVEIEGEGRRRGTIRDNLSAFWRVEADGSLRNNGFEVVLNEPLGGESLRQALSEVPDALRGTSFTFRTSVHIHLDVADLSMDALNRLLFYYTILEKDLFNWVGNGRDQNPYCVPFYRQNNIIYSMMEALNGRYGELVNEERYSAVNCDALKKFTSLEFRHMYGTRSYTTIMNWVNILLAMRKAAIEGVYEVGYNVLQDVSNRGHEEFARPILGAMYDHVVTENTPINVMEGARVAQNFVALDREKIDILQSLTRQNEDEIEKAVGPFVEYNG